MKIELIKKSLLAEELIDIYMYLNLSFKKRNMIITKITDSFETAHHLMYVV